MPTKKKPGAKNATRGAEDLGRVLDGLDKLWKERVPALSLRPGYASGAGALAKAIGGELPPELELWFSWHDGQTSSTPLSDESTFFLHSSASAADAYAFLRSEAEAYDPAWVPKPRSRSSQSTSRYRPRRTPATGRATDRPRMMCKRTLADCARPRRADAVFR